MFLTVNLNTKFFDIPEIKSKNMWGYTYQHIEGFKVLNKFMVNILNLNYIGLDKAPLYIRKKGFIYFRFEDSKILKICVEDMQFSFSIKVKLPYKNNRIILYMKSKPSLKDNYKMILDQLKNNNKFNLLINEGFLPFVTYF